MKKGLGRRFVVFGLVVLLLSSFVFQASAYVINPWERWESVNSLSFYFAPNVSSTIKSGVYRGASAWHSEYPSVYIYETQSNDKITINTVNSTVAPYYNANAVTFRPTVNMSGNATHQYITFNLAYPTYLSDSGAVQSVACHEFGHVLGLGDLYGGQAVLMNGNTYGTNSRWGTHKIKTPQTDDVNGVKSIY